MTGWRSSGEPAVSKRRLVASNLCSDQRVVARVSWIGNAMEPLSRELGERRLLVRWQQRTKRSPQWLECRSKCWERLNRLKNNLVGQCWCEEHRSGARGMNPSKTEQGEVWGSLLTCEGTGIHLMEDKELIGNRSSLLGMITSFEIFTGTFAELSLPMSSPTAVFLRWHWKHN